MHCLSSNAAYASLLQARKFSTIVQLLLPSVFILLMFLLSKAIKPTDPVTNPAANSLQPITRCKPWNNEDCHTLLFAPKRGTSAIVDRVIESFLEVWPWQGFAQCCKYLRKGRALWSGSQVIVGMTSPHTLSALTHTFSG